jgi:transcriptional regulator with XRE-family HTH domain
MDMNDLRAAFEAIECERAKEGISQAELARAAGLSEATYNKLVRNAGRTPYRRTVVKLRAGLDRLTAEVAA